MKKLILVLFLGLFTLAVFSQERTVTKDVKKGFTYYKYTGTSADTLIETNQDTIDIVFQLELSQRISKIAVKSRFDVISGADTTVAISVDGKLFSDDSYTSIINSTLSDAVTADNTVKTVSTTFTESLSSAAYVMLTDTTGLSGYPADSISVPSYTITATPADYSYRYIRVRYIIQGDDSVGTGIKIDEVELKVYL